MYMKKGEKYRFNPLYRGTWFPTSWIDPADPALSLLFQSAISRYLVSNTWLQVDGWAKPLNVSIRYIAVLGFQRVSPKSMTKS